MGFLFRAVQAGRDHGIGDAGRGHTQRDYPIQGVEVGQAPGLSHRGSERNTAAVIFGAMGHGTPPVKGVASRARKRTVPGPLQETIGPRRPPIA